jgi:hypothetical protein
MLFVVTVLCAEHYPEFIEGGQQTVAKNHTDTQFFVRCRCRTLLYYRNFYTALSCCFECTRALPGFALFSLPSDVAPSCWSRALVVFGARLGFRFFGGTLPANDSSGAGPCEGGCRAASTRALLDGIEDAGGGVSAAARIPASALDVNVARGGDDGPACLAGGEGRRRGVGGPASSSTGEGEGGRFRPG